MKVTRKILAGLGTLVLTTGSLIGDPAKAQEYPFKKGFQQGFGWGGTPAKAGGLTNWNLTGDSTSEPTQSDAKVPDDWRTVRLAIVDFYKKGFERINVETPYLRDGDTKYAINRFENSKRILVSNIRTQIPWYNNLDFGPNGLYAEFYKDYLPRIANCIAAIEGYRNELVDLNNKNKTTVVTSSIKKLDNEIANVRELTFIKTDWDTDKMNAIQDKAYVIYSKAMDGYNANIRLQNEKINQQNQRNYQNTRPLIWSDRYRAYDDCVKRLERIYRLNVPFMVQIKTCGGPPLDVYK